MEADYKIAGMACRVFDNDGNNLMAVGRQDLCVMFTVAIPPSVPDAAGLVVEQGALVGGAYIRQDSKLLGIADSSSGQAG